MKRKLYIIFGQLLWIAGIACLLVLLMSSVSKKQKAHCSGMDIRIEDGGGKVFIDEKEIAAIINDHTSAGKATSASIDGFDLRSLEADIKKNPWIRHCNLYFDNNRVLHAVIEERTPVARIIEQRGASYYIDSSTMQLPLSENDRADVPVFTNLPVPNKSNSRLRKSLLNDVKALALVVMQDSFWLAQAAQFWVSPTGHFELYPSVGNHVIKLGSSEGIADKMGRCKAFYQQVLSDKGLDTYREINAAYNGQIVAVKADGMAAPIDGAKAVVVFDQMVKRNRRAAMDNGIETKESKGRMISTEPTAESRRSNRSDTKQSDLNQTENKASQAEPTEPKVPKAVMPKRTTLN